MEYYGYVQSPMAYHYLTLGKDVEIRQSLRLRRWEQIGEIVCCHHEAGAPSHQISYISYISYII